MKKTICLIMTCLACLVGQAQKRPLDAEAYGRWQRVADQDISDDGKWVLYRVVSQNGRDAGAPFQLYDTEHSQTFQLDRAENPTFLAQGKWLTYATRDTSVNGQDTTWILRLSDMKKTCWERQERFSPIGHSDLILWKQPIPDSNGQPGTFRRFVFGNIVTGDTVAIDSVYNYTLYNNNRSIVFVKKMGNYHALLAGALKGPYRFLHNHPQEHVSGFTLNEKTGSGTFSVRSDSLIYAYSLKGEKTLLFRRSDIPLPDGMWASNLNLSKDHSYVTYEMRPLAPPVEPEFPEKDASFDLQLWTWNEEIPPSRQEIDGFRARREYPKYVYYLKNRANVCLADAGAGELSWGNIGGGGKYILLLDEEPYRSYMDRRENLHCDIWAVDRFTGERKLLFSDQAEGPVWAPGGKYALIFRSQQKQWYKFDACTGNVEDLTSSVGVAFHQEDHDKPCPPASYGIAGWLPGGTQVLLNDRYDWWLFDLTGKQVPRCYTQGYGRKHHISIRLLRANFDPQVIDIRTSLLVETFNHSDKREGIARLNPGGKLHFLVNSPHKYTVYKLSEDQKACIFTRQNFCESRDLWWSTMDFSRPQQVTHINSCQSEYLWGKARLVGWINGAGKPNQGILYLPENYDSTRLYPTLVQFYETHTEEIHIYHAPAFSMAMADVATYVSHGYAVFMPDVHFTVGNPGQSTCDAVISGVQMLIDKKIADPARIGLQGHSWSGFQASYLVTKTDIFCCANIGAPITDMVSGYVGVRNGSGLIRFFMYEDTQSRMGKSIWEAKEAYLRHSPLLEADKITTPLLIFHCDGDEAVAYEQGRALYLAMRRLQKPAWLLNYKGDGHFLGNPAAQRDWTIRMQQFFDHYLKDAPMPRWMKEGINIRERGHDQKYDYVK